MAKTRRSGRFGCLLMAGCFYLFLRLLLVTSVAGHVTGVKFPSKDRHSVVVHYSYQVNGESYAGSDKLSDRYLVHSNGPVTVKYWRIWRGMSSVSTSSFAVRKGESFWDQVLDLVVRYAVAGVVVLVGMALGIMKRPS